jgi:hypothetical protein
MKKVTTGIVMLLVLVPIVAAQQAEPVNPKLSGRWHVTFALQGDPKKNLIFEPQAKGAGTLRLLDTGVDDKPVADPVPAVWSELSNNRVSVTGEIELQLGTCCREVGTLIFKGKWQSSTSITGKIIFVTSIDEDESPYRLRSYIGTFTAAPVK